MIEYYIAASVGDLESSTREIKRRIINALQDIRGTWSLTDDPHITLQVGRTQNFEDLLRSYKRVACAYQPFKFTVGETQVHEKQGLIEINAPVYSPVLAELQQALLDASSAHLDHIVPRMFRTSDWDDARRRIFTNIIIPMLDTISNPTSASVACPRNCYANSTALSMTGDPQENMCAAGWIFSRTSKTIRHLLRRRVAQ